MNAKGVIRAVVAVVVALASVTSAHAADEAGRTWLQRMSEALTSLNYQGTFAYYHGDMLDTLQVTHTLHEGESWERLVHLNGPIREIVRRGKEVACILSRDDEMFELSGSIPAGPFAGSFGGSFGALPTSYSVRVVGVGRVADRAAVELSIEPIDDLRYGYRLWVDEETALMLRSELVSMEGELLEAFQFTELRLGAGIDPVRVRSTGDHEILHTLRMMPTASNDGPKEQSEWAPDWVPPGFSMATSDLRRTGADRMPLSSVVYSDGLVSLSVFVEMLGEMELHEQSNVVRNGATVGVSRLVMGSDGMTYLATVVGDVPEATARRVLAGVRDNTQRVASE